MVAADMSPHLPPTTEVPPTALSRNLAHLVRVILIMETALRLNYSSPGLSEGFLEEYNISLDELTRLLNHSHVQTPWKPPPQCYCGGKMKEVLGAYKAVHGYLALIVCLFGTVANVLNVVVLTRKDMKAAPINRILKALAIADMLVMVEYVPFTLYFYLVLPGQINMPYHWAVYVLFHSHFTQVLHTISICLTLVLAIWRYTAIRFPQKSHVLCSAWRCKLAIIIGYSLPVLVCIPSYLVFRIQATAAQSDHGEVLLLYHIDLSDMARKHDETLYYVNLWIYGVVIKLLPCVILTVISCWLIKALYRANRRKQALKGFNSNCNATAPLAPNSRPPTRSERRTDRTTKMLVAVLLLFLITEFPQGILGLLSGVFGRCFFRTCYTMFGEVMDILALLNGAINFILYCSMSRQFRTTFGQLFKPRMLANWNIPASQTEVQSTYV